jgi:hypothetical protein
MRRALSLVAVLCIVFAPGSFEGGELSRDAAELSARVLAPTIHESRPPQARELTQGSRLDRTHPRGQGREEAGDAVVTVPLWGDRGTASIERGASPQGPLPASAQDPIRGPPHLPMA